MRACTSSRARENDHDGLAEDPPSPQHSTAQPGKERNDKAKLDEKWRREEPAMRETILSMVPQYAQWAEEKAAAEQQLMQARIDCSYQHRTAKCSGCISLGEAAAPVVCAPAPCYRNIFSLLLASACNSMACMRQLALA